MPVKYDQETKAKAIRLVREHAGDYPSEYAAITAVAGRLGMTAETLRKWVRQAGIDEGQAPGVSSEAAREIRELRRKNRELEQTVEILKAATSFFAREHNPLRHRHDLNHIRRPPAGRARTIDY
jgi:transposase